MKDATIILLMIVVAALAFCSGRSSSPQAIIDNPTVSKVDADFQRCVRVSPAGPLDGPPPGKVDRRALDGGTA